MTQVKWVQKGCQYCKNWRWLPPLAFPLCWAHQCRHCKVEVDELATHALSEDHHPHHAGINKIRSPG